MFLKISRSYGSKSRFHLLQRIAKDKELPQKAIKYHYRLAEKTLTSELQLSETKKWNEEIDAIMKEFQTPSVNNLLASASRTSPIHHQDASTVTSPEEIQR